jgi:hypothetical protein
MAAGQLRLDMAAHLVRGAPSCRSRIENPMSRPYLDRRTLEGLEKMKKLVRTRQSCLQKPTRH